VAFLHERVAFLHERVNEEQLSTRFLGISKKKELSPYKMTCKERALLVK
jgi:hypothetical protein